MSDNKAFNTPRNMGTFTGQFIVFFPEDAEPQVLFSTFVAEEAYTKAQEIKQQQGREPVVFRVQASTSGNISHVLATRN